MVALPKRERTRSRLVTCALELFEAQGFENTSVAQIAAAAGVSEMTFFRHFGSKEAAVTTDPFDPVLAAAIGARPADEKPLVRTVRGLREAFEGVAEPEVDVMRRRIRLVAGSSTLRAAAARENEVTEMTFREQLAADGADALAARIAAAAVIAALTAALYEWAEHEERTLAWTIEQALDALEDRHG